MALLVNFCSTQFVLKLESLKKIGFFQQKLDAFPVLITLVSRISDDFFISVWHPLNFVVPKSFWIFSKQILKKSV